MSTTSSLPDVPEKFTAPLLFGVLGNWTLYGVLVVQIYVYSYNFPDDRKLLKLLVYSIFFLETLQTALGGADLYYWFSSGLDNPYHLANSYASAFDVPIIGSIVSGTVQFFFVYRVWVLSDRKSGWYCVLIAVCTTLGTFGAFTKGLSAYVHTYFIYMFGERNISTLIWTIGNTVTDILIVAGMLYYLMRRRNPDSGPWSNHALVKIVRLTIETNILTTTTSVIALLLMVIPPTTNSYSFCPLAILGKLYSNTLLVSLNNRIAIRDSEISPGRGALLTSPTRPAPTAKDSPSSVNLEIGNPPSPCAFEERKQSGESVEDDGRDGVIDIA